METSQVFALNRIMAMHRVRFFSFTKFFTKFELSYFGPGSSETPHVLGKAIKWLQINDSPISLEAIQILIENLPDLQFKTFPCVSQCLDCIEIRNCQQKFYRKHYVESVDLLFVIFHWRV